MAKGFADFCGGQFWNESQLIDNSWPHLTDCFVHTALVWLPCGFLLLALPYYVLSVRRNATPYRLGLTFLVGFKLTCCVLLCVMSVVQLVHKVTDHGTWSTAACLADGLWTAAYVTVGLMTHVERVHGVQGQGVPFFFWLVCSLSSVVPLYTLVQLQVHTDDPLHFTTTVIIAVLQFMSLALTFFVDDLPYKAIHTTGKGACPETTCCFPSFLVFWWMTPMILTGYRRELKDTDMWQLNPKEQSDTVVPVFNAAWLDRSSPHNCVTTLCGYLCLTRCPATFNKLICDDDCRLKQGRSRSQERSKTGLLASLFSFGERSAGRKRRTVYCWCDGDMERFCEGQLWNTSLLVDNTWPQFTDCFRHTVLIWLPCAFLFLMLPYYVTSVRQRATDIGFKITALFGARLCCCITLAILSFLHLAMRTRALTISTSPAAYLGDALYILSYTTLCLMTQYERLKGVHTSTIPFFFWLLTSLCNIIHLYTMVILKLYAYYTVSFTVFLLTYSLQLCSLALTAFVNNRGNERGKKGQRLCPETTCSFPSYLTFWWMTRLVVTGFGRDLEEGDLWQLPAGERSANLADRFNRLWAEEQRVCQQANRKEQCRATNASQSTKESTHLLDNGSPPDHHKEEEEGRRRPRLLRTLVRMMAGDFCVIFLQKAVSDFLYLCTPLLLGAMMRYLSSRETGREWQGYVLCVAMFLALLAKSLLFTHSMFHAARVGIRMKSTLIAAIYHKALSMSKRNTATVGEIVNLMSVDAQRVQDVMVVCFYAATSPLQIVVAIVLLYYTIGPSIFVGLLLLLCLVPINAYVITRNRQLQSSNLKFKDARIKLYSEVLNGIKVLKLYAWESSFRARILETRLKEVAVLFKMAVLNTIMSLCWEMAPFLVTLVTFATYVLSDPNNKLDAGKAFVTLALFNVIRPPLAMLAKMIMYTILVQVSIKRLRHFLVSDALNPDAVIREDWGRPAICVEDGTFTWNGDQSSPALHNINLTIGEGRLVAVVGPVGCGKSSLISAMLGEMEKVKGAVVFKGSIAYVPQQAWILNATVRDNILFGKPFSRTRYRRIVEKCELERDLTILSAGDMTEIGEKGINLSGGQKQRVSVARAVYSDSDVYLLDDPLSAVDSHVGKAIFSNIIGPSGILRNKTRVLVTHGLHWLPMVDEVIVMHDGKISERGSYEELVSHDGPFAQFLKTYLTEVFEVEEAEDPEIAEIHGRMRVRLGSVTSCESSDDDALRARVRCLKGRQQAAARRGNGVEDSLTMSATSDTDIEGSRDGPGRLNTPEAVSKGKVDPSVFRYYASAVGLLPILLALLSFCVFQVLSVGSSYWLKEWSRHSSPPYLPTLLSYTNHTTVTSYVTASNYTTDSNYTMVDNNTTDSNHSTSAASDPYTPQDKDNHDDRFYLAIYGVLGIGQVVFLFAFNMVHWTRMAVSARTLHARLADSMMHAPMAFFDTTPTGRVLNRVSYDVETVDTSLPFIIRDWLVTFALVLVTLAVIMIQTPLAGVVLLPTAVLYYFCQRFYVPTARQLRRIECVTRTPIYVLFSETISGAASIRAYDVTQRFLEESKSRVDHNQVYFFAFQAAIRWMQWNLDVLSAVIVLVASVFAIADTTNDSADAGLCISYALQLSGTLTWMTRQICDFETNIVSVERLKEYSEITPEADWTIPENNPPAQWPERGEVTFNNYTTRYRPDLPLVLKGVTCTIRPGQKVGVVGRTWAGKSSLALSLFRLVEAAGGSIVIDGVNIADMGLHDLRARLTILPQEPVLFSGTLRMNLDPFDEYTDTQLWTALTRAHLHHVVAALPQHLHFQCGEEGGNLSVGQKQLVCLARTLLRRTKILVLDEATAAVDMETDALIQNTIRTAFSHSTVITIAHRLNTIMDYDKILVMSGGRIEEFAPPDVLLADRSSAFFGMAREAGLV